MIHTNTTLTPGQLLTLSSKLIELGHRDTPVKIHTGRYGAIKVRTVDNKFIKAFSPHELHESIPVIPPIGILKIEGPFPQDIEEDIVMMVNRMYRKSLGYSNVFDNLSESLNTASHAADALAYAIHTVYQDNHTYSTYGEESSQTKTERTTREDLISELQLHKSQGADLQALYMLNGDIDYTLRFVVMETPLTIVGSFKSK